MPKFILPRAISCKQDLTKIDKMLSKELQRLQTEAIILSQQCQSNSQKLRQYKCRIEETWSVARDEAAKCKAAKDVIKVLTNQMNAISAGKEMNNTRSLLDDKVDTFTPCPAQRELPEPQNAKLVCSSTRPSHDAQIPEDRQISGLSDQPMSSTYTVTGATLLDSAPKTTSDRVESVPKASKDEWVDQDERGVYITFITLPSGQKGLKRVRFSRKHFSGKQAEQWWEENHTRIYVKYNIERIVMSSKDKRNN